jgi:hypothetical protein
VPGQLLDPAAGVQDLVVEVLGYALAGYEVRPCVVCERPLSWTRRAKVRFCSDACRVRAYRERLKANAARLAETTP